MESRRNDYAIYIPYLSRISSKTSKLLSRGFKEWAKNSEFSNTVNA
nr:hypothetical protein [Bacillus sp. MB2021]